MLITLAAMFATVLAAFLLRKELKSRGFLSSHNRNARSNARLQRGRTTKSHR